MAAKVATGKCKGAMGPTIMKGILANWLVCLAAFMATIETDLAGMLLDPSNPNLSPGPAPFPQP